MNTSQKIYHYSPKTKRAEPCTGNCDYGESTPHGSTPEEAEGFAEVMEERQAENIFGTSTVAKAEEPEVNESNHSQVNAFLEEGYSTEAHETAIGVGEYFEAQYGDDVEELDEYLDVAMDKLRTDENRSADSIIRMTENEVEEDYHAQVGDFLSEGHSPEAEKTALEVGKYFDEQYGDDVEEVDDYIDNALDRLREDESLSADSVIRSTEKEVESAHQYWNSEGVIRAYDGDPYSLESLRNEAESISTLEEARAFAKNNSNNSAYTHETGEPSYVLTKIERYEDGTYRDTFVLFSEEDKDAVETSSKDELYVAGKRKGVTETNNVDQAEKSLSESQKAFLDDPDNDELHEDALTEADEEHGHGRKSPVVMPDGKDREEYNGEIASAVKEDEIKGLNERSYQDETDEHGFNSIHHAVRLVNKDGREVSMDYRSGTGLGHDYSPSVSEIVETAASDVLLFESYKGRYDEAAGEMGEMGIDELKDHGYTPDDQEWKDYEKRKREFDSIQRMDNNFSKFFGRNRWEGLKETL